MAVKVFVDSVRIDMSKSTRLERARSTHIVLLKDVKIDRYLPIHIGEWESASIIAELQGQKMIRPLTHDLLNTMLERLEVRVASIIVHTLQNDVFYANINLEQGERQLEIDARPSDAIALAVRCNAPLFVEEPVFEQAGFKIPAKGEEEEEKLSVFRDFVNQLDF